MVSVLNDLRGIEQRVAARLEELRPLIEEYEELRRIADRLGLDVDAAPKQPARAARAERKVAAPRRTRRRATTSGRRRAGGTRATGAERRARVLELIQQRPGISVPDISKELGVDPPPLYRVVRKLQADGVIKKEGTALRLA